MFQSIKYISKPGNIINEDYVGYSDSFLFVLDGATGLGNRKPNEKGTEASRFVSLVGERLQSCLEDLSKNTKEILQKAVRISENYTIDKTFSDSEHAELIEHSRGQAYLSPSASISIFRINGTLLEYYGLGDCTATIQFQDGSIRTIHEDTITLMDQKVIATMAELARKKAVTVREAKNEIIPFLIENRNKKNTQEGYWTLDATGIGIAHGIHLTFPLQEVQSVSLMSDGFAQICDTFYLVRNFDELHEKMAKEDLSDMVKELFDIQDTDPDYNQYPRFKHRDDTTVIFSILNG
ncbi:protein phosphatase 2C domain-containing protein [Sinanaerobacter chloroacetimidivorans]|uniref:Protein phosphatase 2C domain-containing protein n=1 Tax=Sinanaerobacter chloroacetimidivorans TaxID=2818044 RepID=A0A8J7W279_9FIRM|nr:protein phosphatase 2C domain-containing protein [Sinanaerobacter chloroacetimidivorans]MBR0599547.1 protein phosphatase 2C domain-containing protein [Sinanaerobacter chloroacetimidivorans]